MLKSYPQLLILEVVKHKVILYRLQSYSGSGTAHYKCEDEEYAYKWSKWLDVRGRYPKMWRESLVKKGLRELTETEELLFGKI